MRHDIYKHINFNGLKFGLYFQICKCVFFLFSVSRYMGHFNAKKSTLVWFMLASPCARFATSQSPAWHPKQYRIYHSGRFLHTRYQSMYRKTFYKMAHYVICLKRVTSYLILLPLNPKKVGSLKQHQMIIALRAVFGTFFLIPSLKHSI